MRRRIAWIKHIKKNESNSDVSRSFYATPKRKSQYTRPLRGTWHESDKIGHRMVRHLSEVDYRYHDLTKHKSQHLYVTIAQFFSTPKSFFTTGHQLILKIEFWIGNWPQVKKSSMSVHWSIIIATEVVARFGISALCALSRSVVGTTLKSLIVRKWHLLT